MEIELNESYKTELKPIIYNTSREKFSLTISILNQIRLSDKRIWLSCLGIKSKNSDWTCGFKLELKQMLVIEENGRSDWFLPARFGLRKLTPTDNENGRNVVTLFCENSNIEKKYNDLKDFSGFEFDNYSEKFTLENLFTKRIEGIANNGIRNKKDIKYFEFKFVFDFPLKQVTIEEIDPIYRARLFEYMFE